MNNSISQYVKGEFLTFDAREILQQEVKVLIGVDDEIVEALKLININNVFDLAVSRVFNTAREIVEANQGSDSTFAQYGFASSDAVIDSKRGTPVSDLASEDISVLNGIGSKKQESLSRAIQLQTVRDFSYWSPFQAARKILSSVFGGDTLDDDPDAPAELLPEAGEYATEKYYYPTIFLDEIIDGEEELEELAGQQGKLKIDITDLKEGFSTPATGAVLTFEQAWYPHGLSLGQLLHSMALAPAESTKLAVIDWSRNISSSTQEDINQTESLDNLASTNRVMGETANAIARQVQKGYSRTKAYGKSENEGGAVGGSVLGITGAYSYGYSENASNAMSVSSSSGVRNVTGSMTQKIAQVTHQQANSTRNRRAAIIREVSQKESESISTRTVTNYNHSHALSIHYYEVVQIYRVVTRLSKCERCIFIPMEMIDFCDARLIFRYKDILQWALSSEYRHLFNALRGFAILKRDKDSQMDFIRQQYTDNKERKLFEQSSWSLDIDSNLSSISIQKGANLVEKIKVEILDCDTQENRTYELAKSENKFYFEQPCSVTKIKNVTFVHLTQELPAGAHHVLILDFNFTKLLSSGEQHISIGFTLEQGQKSVRLVSFPNSPDIQELSGKLNEDPIFYSQLIWQNLDPSAVTLLLSKYRFRGKRLINYVDPRPLTTYGNYLVLRYTYGEDADSNQFSSLNIGYSATSTSKIKLDQNSRLVSVKIDNAELYNNSYNFQLNIDGMESSLLPQDISLNKVVSDISRLSLIAYFREGGESINDTLEPLNIVIEFNKENGEITRTVHHVYPHHFQELENQSSEMLLLWSDESNSSYAELKQWLNWKNKHIDFAKIEQQTVPMATGGTFAEAVLGRFNASEKLDVTRFWNWQDSPIPIQAPNIAPVQSGSRGEKDTTTPGRLDAPVVNIMNPPSLPDPQGMSAILNAISNPNLFRDMSGLAVTASLAQQALKSSGEGATAAAAQAGQNMKTVAELEKARLEMIGKLIGGGGLTKSSVSKVGALLNHGAKLDAKKKQALKKKIEGADTQGEQPSNSGESPSNTTGEEEKNDNSPESNEVEAFKSAVGSQPKVVQAAEADGGRNFTPMPESKPSNGGKKPGTNSSTDNAVQNRIQKGAKLVTVIGIFKDFRGNLLTNHEVRLQFKSANLPKAYTVEATLDGHGGTFVKKVPLEFPGTISITAWPNYPPKIFGPGTVYSKYVLSGATLYSKPTSGTKDTLILEIKQEVKKYTTTEENEAKAIESLKNNLTKTLNIAPEILPEILKIKLPSLELSKSDERTTTVEGRKKTVSTYVFLKPTLQLKIIAK